MKMNLMFHLNQFPRRKRLNFDSSSQKIKAPYRGFSIGWENHKLSVLKPFAKSAFTKS